MGIGTWARRHKKKLVALVLLAAAGPAAHGVVLVTTKIQPPAVVVSSERPTVDDPKSPTALRRLGRAWTRTRGGVREAYLEGGPEALGAQHARLLGDRMAKNEQVLWDGFAALVPVSPIRTLMMDIGRVRYRQVDRGMPEPRRRELAAEAAAFAPDPYEAHLPTYHRMVFLHALYDIALSFEHSPLLGCSSFGLGPGATRDGHALFARAFDFEVGDVFDRDKAVFFVREDGAIPYASVAWPGLQGALSGMNLEGVAAVVHGGRAGEPRTEGLPVVFSVREVLQRAHDTKEAVDILSHQQVMVSHIVFVGDPEGRYAVVERAPGHAAFVRTSFADPDRVGVTNHFEGPLASDPKNVRVRESTSTTARRARLDELLATVGPKEGDVERAVALLRDHRCAGGVECPLGDRRSIDALIATHGIVADLTERALWVSAGPHLSGKFVRYDLKQVFAGGHDPKDDGPPASLEEDPILFDGRYEIGRARAGGPMIKGGTP